MHKYTAVAVWGTQNSAKSVGTWERERGGFPLLM